jgi:Ca2+-binding EF-hand superfamily protein
MSKSKTPPGKSDDFGPPGLNKDHQGPAPNGDGHGSSSGNPGRGGLADDDASPRPEHPDTDPDDHGHGGPGTGTPPDTPPEPPEPPTLDEFVTEFFATFDADTDGSITLEEMLAVLDPTAAHRGFDKHVGQLLAAVDADGDLGISQTELEKALTQLDAEHHGKPDGPPGRLHSATVQLVKLALKADDDASDPPPPPPPPPPPTLTEFVDTLFETFDADGNASITLEEMLAVLDPDAAHRGFDKHVGKVFAALDADQDLGLSREELETALVRLDAEHPGKPEDMPGRLHAATVQLVGLALMPDDTPDDGG